jgi:hypothetical protein
MIEAGVAAFCEMRLDLVGYDEIVEAVYAAMERART